MQFRNISKYLDINDFAQANLYTLIQLGLMKCEEGDPDLYLNTAARFLPRTYLP